MQFGAIVKSSKRFLVFSILIVFAYGTPGVAATTAITYQGRLLDGGLPANGNYDLVFSLYDDISEGSQIGTTLTNSPLAVTNGLFTAALDFGKSAFNGESRWVEVAVRTGTNDFKVLSPRQPIT